MAESDGGGYQLRRSPFVQRQMAKGKRFDKPKQNGVALGHPQIDIVG